MLLYILCYLFISFKFILRIDVSDEPLRVSVYLGPHKVKYCTSRAGDPTRAVRWTIWAHPRAPTYRPPFVSSIHHQLSLSSSPRLIMSADPSTSTSHTNFASIFNAALESYKRKTKRDLTSHPLLPSLQSCDSPKAILAVLREQIPVFDESHDGDDRVTKWVSPTVNVLYAFSATVGQGVGLVRIGLFCRREFPLKHFTIRHSHRQMQSLPGSAFSSWSVFFMCRLHRLY